MCAGVALPASELPTAFVARADMAFRLHDRGAVREVRFLWTHRPAALPVEYGGRVGAVAWGCRDRKSPLPFGPWLPEEELAKGVLQHLRPERVVIPAKYGVDAGMWFAIHVGVWGVLVRTPARRLVVYMLTTRSSYYYRNMCEQVPRMPVLVRQVI